VGFYTKNIFSWEAFQSFLPQHIVATFLPQQNDHLIYMIRGANLFSLLNSTATTFDYSKIKQNCSQKNISALGHCPIELVRLLTMYLSDSYQNRWTCSFEMIGIVASSMMAFNQEYKQENISFLTKLQQFFRCSSSHVHYRTSLMQVCKIALQGYHWYVVHQ
jgi:hypothetical protein